MILGTNCDAPIYELLNDNSYECKVVDLCTGAGHWYVVYLSRSFKLHQAVGCYTLTFEILLPMTTFRVLEMAEKFPHVKFRGLDLGA